MIMQGQWHALKAQNPTIVSELARESGCVISVSKTTWRPFLSKTAGTPKEKKRKEKKRKEKKRKEKTTPFSVNSIRSPVIYRAPRVTLKHCLVLH